MYKHNSCESFGRSKHMNYRAGNEVYGRIWLSKTKLKTCILHNLCGENVNISIDCPCLRSWICRVTNRVHIAWTQTGRHSILNWITLNNIPINTRSLYLLKYAQYWWHGYNTHVHYISYSMPNINDTVITHTFIISLKICPILMTRL